jgi:hypothetical protein
MLCLARSAIDPFFVCFVSFVVHSFLVRAFRVVRGRFKGWLSASAIGSPLAMRAFPILLLLIAVGLARPALAAPDGSDDAGYQPPPTVAKDVGPAPPAKASPARRPLARIAGLAAQPLADDGACRSQCAQSYYFCAAPGQGGDCGGAWSQCAAACDAPGLAEALPPTPR